MQKLKVHVRLFFIFALLLQTAFAQQHAGVVLPNYIYTLPALPDNYKDIQQSSLAYAFAYPFEVDLNVKTQAAKVQTDSSYIYFYTLVSPGAYSLNVIFNQFYIPQGGTLEFYNPEKTYYAGPFSFVNNHPSGIFPSPLIAGDTLMIKCEVYKNTDDSLQLNIYKVCHDFEDILKTSSGLKASAGECNVDVNCSEGDDWQNEKRAVVKLYIAGTYQCTGTLINNTLNDGTPYVLTANHCLETNIDALSTVFYFGYEQPTCGGSETVSQNKYLSGSELRATSPDSKIDFTLLEINEVPPEEYLPYYAGWDISENIPVGAVSIHHPRGDVKKISKETDKPHTFIGQFYTFKHNTHWEIEDWEVGTTESGSSGGPLFSSNHKLIGDLSGGDATCLNPVYDYFQKFSVSYDYYSGDNSLKKWLDPLNMGVSDCPPFDPLQTSNDVVTNITSNDSLYIWNFGKEAGGTMGGVTEIGWTQAAERFYLLIHKNIYDLMYLVDTNTGVNLSNVELCVWDGIDKPENLLFSKTLEKTDIIDSKYIHLTFDNPIETTGTFWVGYKILQSEKNISFYLAESRSSKTSTFYVNHSKGWVNASFLGANTALGVQVKLTNEVDTLSPIIPFEPPYFNTKVFADNYTFYSDELFGIDSLSGIADTTMLVHLSTVNNVSDWGGLHEINVECLTQKYALHSDIIIRGLKLGVHEVATNGKTSYCLWDKYGNLLMEDSVDNSLLSAKYFNQMHFSNLVPVQDTFYMGVCFNTNVDVQNISLYNYYDSEVLRDSYIKLDGENTSYKELGFDYNLAIDPILCFSEYHFNIDSAKILKYKIKNISDVELPNKKQFELFPTSSNGKFDIIFKNAIYSKIHVEIYSLIGTQVYNNEVELVGGSYPITTSDLGSGVYVVKVVTGNFTEEKKIVIY